MGLDLTVPKRRFEMPWCPACATEYEAWVKRCTDCDVYLTATKPERPGEPVVVLVTGTVSEAAIAEAALKAEGILAFTRPAEDAVPGFIIGDTADTCVVVPAYEAERAVAILNAGPLTAAEVEALELEEPS
jgi:hypothetical protein